MTDSAVGLTSGDAHNSKVEFLRKFAPLNESVVLTVPRWSADTAKASRAESDARYQTRARILPINKATA